MEVLLVIAIAIWVALPAYIPNNVAVLAGGGPPIDGGRRWRGARVLGDGKTWRGTLFGIGGGILVAVLLNVLNVPVGQVLGVDLPTFPPEIIVGFPVGALLGDILASFLKRRTGRERGSSFPLVDQLDFLIVALLVGTVLAPAWMSTVFTLPILAAVFLLTPLLHVATNVLAYAFGLKQEPW